MTLAILFTRLHGAILVLIGRVKLPKVPLERLEFEMALEQLKAAVAAADSAADRLIADCQSHAAEISSLQSQLADEKAAVAAADADAAALVQPLADKLAAAAPAPVDGSGQPPSDGSGSPDPTP